MKAILISMHQKWCELIFSGKKTVEVRKTAPKLMPPFKVFVYETRTPVLLKDFKRDGALYHAKLSGARGKVVGSFVCKNISVVPAISEMTEGTCLTIEQLNEYGCDGKGYLRYWQISDPIQFDKPKELADFSVYGRCDEECSEYDICMKYDSEESRYGCAYFKKTPLKRAPQSWCYVEEI